MDKFKKNKALKLYFAGKPKFFIMDKLEISEKQLDKWIKDTCVDSKRTALYMFFYWNCGKLYICKTLKIKPETFEKWIIKKCGGVKNTAIYLYFRFLYSKDRISRELKVPGTTIKEWIDEYYSDKNEKVVNCERPNIQEGFSTWVTKIIDEHRKIS